jgi:chitinase
MNRRRFIGLTATLGSGILTGAVSAAEAPKPAVFSVAGYFPDYRISVKNLARVQYLTDLIAFSLEPRETGDLEMRSWDAGAFAVLRKARTDHGCRLLACLGGWDRSEGFRAALSSADARERLVRSIRDLCEQEKLDGIDLDWEHPKTLAEARQYGTFMELLKLALGPQRTVSAAVAVDQTWWEDSVHWLDRLHLMAYDLPGRHSTLQDAEQAVERWLKQGVPARKISLGLPLYGRGVTQRDRTLAFSDMAAKPDFRAESDEWDGLYFNGPSTLADKVALAKRLKLAGVFAWEIGQDAEGDKSLLKSIKAAASKA